MARTRANQASAGSDPVIQWLVIAAFSVVVLILTAAMWVIMTGISDPPAPRSYHERQIDLLASVVKTKPKVARAWADYARAYIAAKQYSQAARVLDRGERAVGTSTPELALERARLAAAQGHTEEATKLAKKAIDLTEAARQKVFTEMAAKSVTIDVRTIKHDEMASALELYGDLLAEQKHWSKAAQAYGFAIQEKPESVDFLVKQGAVYLELNDTNKAKADFEKALTYVPDFEPALTGLERIKKGSAK